MTATTTTTTETQLVLPTQLESSEKIQYPGSLVVSGALDQFQYDEVTPVIGREYPTVNVVDDLINATNSDELLRDLAITVSERGVVFFRSQDNLTDELQKALVQKLGELTGKPSESTLHIHPIVNWTSEFAVKDREVSTISSDTIPAFSRTKDRDDTRKGAAYFHSDIQFEQYPADYTSLRLTTLPKSGGDTLWASGYELYDRFSDTYQRFFEGLTATYSAESFHKIAEDDPVKYQIYTKERGHPANVGPRLVAVHPVVRTNPVTGWKSIFAVGNFPERINELSARESRELLSSLRSRLEEFHDLQVRFKWKNQNDFAIWDNRSVFHSATNDFQGLGPRVGHRTVGIGEKPYYDPRSKSRTEALTARAQEKKETLPVTE